ncbi:MAG TPA: Gfo/Idh/MocA family oxidoreductase [Gemmataceae bacterium]|nr:Gfo/Idh/MocA family oxidoreductase [Gemmataceae bacterium]
MRLRVGVIGLGRRWRRYRSLLARLREHVEVRAVCDQVARRAEIEARRFSCAAAAGPVELLERPDVEAVLLLDAQWYGLWPLEHACRLNKPVLCALSPASDAAHADALHECVQRSGLPVLMALTPLLAPATRYLRELLTHRLGQARLVRADWSAAPPREDAEHDLLTTPALLPLLTACAWLLDDVPRSIWTIDGDSASFVTLVLRFGRDRLAQVNLWTAAAGRPPARFEVVAESGTAAAELPRQLRWRDADGQHAQRLPPRATEHNALERFILALRDGQPLRPNFEDVHQALTWLRAAVSSRSERTSIALR